MYILAKVDEILREEFFYKMNVFLGVEKAVANVQKLAKLLIEVCDDFFIFF